jgi:hypothetical protein
MTKTEWAVVVASILLALLIAILIILELRDWVQARRRKR